jgi:hypothetical protein
MSARTSGQRKVLSIDDDEVLVGSLRQYLTMQNCDVNVAVDPHMAKTLMGGSARGVIGIDFYLTDAVHAEQSVLSLPQSIFLSELVAGPMHAPADRHSDLQRQRTTP